MIFAAHNYKRWTTKNKLTDFKSNFRENVTVVNTWGDSWARNFLKSEILARLLKNWTTGLYIYHQIEKKLAF